MSEPQFKIGRVIRTDAKVCHVDFDGEVMLCAPRGKLFETRGAQRNPIAVGDMVRVDMGGDPKAIEEVLPRRNRLGRMSSMHDPREQVLVANVDKLYIVGSLAKPGFSSNRTDRVLAACQWYGVPAALILNKIDLDKHGDAPAIRKTYEDIGLEVLDTCATSGQGIEALRERLKGRVSAFYGASGVGKSSLLNALQPNLKLKIGKISKFWDQGKHTTTHSQLIPLEFGGYVIDTPGVRSFRLHDAKPAQLRGMFPEFARYQGACRFPDCSHDHEPDCGVFAAVERGQIAPSRFASYIEMLDELRKAPAPDDAPVGDGEE
jgi:ribosome biogenesis GTPase